MRTTLVIQDELFISAKKLAAERGSSLSALVEEALRYQVNRSKSSSKEREEFRIPVLEGQGEPVDSTPGDFFEIGEGEDLDANIPEKAK